MYKYFDRLKAKHPDAMLLFREGDYYEAYFEDAVSCNEILGLEICYGNIIPERDGQRLSYVSFPCHAIDSNLPKLIRAGKRIAICEYPEAIRKKFITD